MSRRPFNGKTFLGFHGRFPLKKQIARCLEFVEIGYILWNDIVLIMITE